MCPVAERVPFSPTCVLAAPAQTSLFTKLINGANVGVANGEQMRGAGGNCFPLKPRDVSSIAGPCSMHGFRRMVRSTKVARVTDKTFSINFDKLNPAIAVFG